MNKIWIAFIAVIIITIVALTGCTAKNENKTNTVGTLQTVGKYTNIKPGEAKKRLESEKGIILLDVRTKEEYLQKHIPGSLLIPVDDLEKEAASKLTDKNATIFVYCRSGNRSVTASNVLVKLGYTKVYNLGGINDWTYETESGEPKK